MSLSTKTQHTIPFMKGTPLLGSVVPLSRNRMKFLSQLSDRGAVTGFYLGPLSAVAFNRADYVHDFLVNRADDFDKGWTMHRSFVGNGVFISEGELHRIQRKIMAPSFRPGTIASYAAIMAQYGERLVANWQDGQEVLIGKEMNGVSMSIIGKTLFDEDMFSEADAMGKALIVVFNHAAHMVVNSPFSLPRDWPTPRNREKDRAWATIRNRLQKMIDERRASPERKREDFLSLLMDARYEDGRAMSDEQLMDECSTLFAGGQETVANSLVWVWVLLCQHPSLYQKVQEEVDTVLQGRTPTYEDLARLPYCQQVYKETLRLYPPAIVVIRQALRDCQIESSEGVYSIKKGMLVLASIYAIHRQPDYFPEPLRFDPDTHFSAEREKQHPRYAFMPFGAGPRICIGNYFAMMEGHLLVALLAQRVNFELVAGQHIVPSSKTLTTRPTIDVRMTVHKRSRVASLP